MGRSGDLPCPSFFIIFLQFCPACGRGRASFSQLKTISCTGRCKLLWPVFLFYWDGLYFDSSEKVKNISLLDVCTGSGCIAVSLAKLGGYADVTALDLSEEALKVAKSNGEKLLDHPVKFIKSDMFSALDPENRYDVIVSNPPYIPSQVIEGLEPEVKDHEPRMALDGEPDGSKFYRILAEEGKKYLKNGGEIYMEIGWDQAKDVTKIFETMGFKGIRTVRDMTGNDRVVCARKEK